MQTSAMRIPFVFSGIRTGLGPTKIFDPLTAARAAEKINFQAGSAHVAVGEKDVCRALCHEAEYDLESVPSGWLGDLGRLMTQYLKVHSILAKIELA